MCLRRWIAFFILFFTVENLYAINSKFETKKFRSVKQYILKQDYKTALKKLNNLKTKNLTSYEKQVYSFAKARLLFMTKNYPFAEVEFQKYIKKKGALSSYAHYYLGNYYFETNQYGKAKSNLKKVMRNPANRNLNVLAKEVMAKYYYKKSQWKKSYNELRFVERKNRGSFDKYPEILWQLAQVEKKRVRKPQFCKWVRKIYSKTPSSKLSDSWGIDLNSNLFEGHKTYCDASLDVKMKRLKTLEWTGYKIRARSEIESLKLHGEVDELMYDRLLSNHLISRGENKKSFKILVNHFDKYKNNVDYINQLANISSYVGNYPFSAGLYYKKYKMQKSNRRKRSALFRSAFMSYRAKDYDGAIRKFSLFNHKYKKSRQRPDSFWYKYWSHYLKGNYKTAISGFSQILKKQKRGRSRWIWRKITKNKLKYWIANSFDKLGETQKAMNIWSKLANEKALGYYTLLSFEKLNNLIVKNELAKDFPSKILEFQYNRKIASIDKIKNQKDLDLTNIKFNETEEELDKEDESAIEETEAVAAVTKKENYEEGISELIKLTKATNQQRLMRAYELILLGFYEDATWEIYEVERRSRKLKIKRELISLYKKVGAYNRSSYVAQVYFSGTRIRSGIKKEKALWSDAYPQAYEKQVLNFSNKFSLDKDVIWSIMKAESKFKRQIQSPVGAQGLMQLMPYTARSVAGLLGEKFKRSRLLDADYNIKIGSRYLKRLSDKFNNKLPLIAAGYNAGPHRVDTWSSEYHYLSMDEFIEHIPFKETRNYVKRVSRNYGMYKILYDDGEKLSWLTADLGYRFAEKISYKETWE